MTSGWCRNGDQQRTGRGLRRAAAFHIARLRPWIERDRDARGGAGARLATPEVEEDAPAALDGRAGHGLVVRLEGGADFVLGEVFPRIITGGRA